MNRMLRMAALGAALGLAALAPASAKTPEPARAYPVDLGEVSGVAYYTVEGKTLRLVATLAQQAEGAAPFRVETLLASGQTVLLSSPRAPGQAPAQVEITRTGNGILVRKPTAALTN